MQASNVAAPSPAITSSVDLVDWRPEDEAFWKENGSRIANRNLWISIPSLLCGFAVWLMWGIITVQMANAGFPFAPDQLFSLAAIAGLSGATTRIPASFFIRICGGRNTVWLTTALLMIPAVGTGIALQSLETPLWVFQLMALLSGMGGGNFACSMANISTFFPKRLQGTALGLNAGLGNFGVTTSQLLIPAVMTMGVFGALGGDAIPLVKDSATLIGKIAAGTPTYVQNAGFVWLLLLVPLAVVGWFGMNNLLTVSPNIGSTGAALGKIILFYGIALVVSAIGLYLYLPSGLGVLAGGGMWIMLPLVILGTLYGMKFAASGEMKTNLDKQFAIFRNKHTWSMTALYVVTFGSFIGFSMALPLSITVIFGNTHVLDPATQAGACEEPERALRADVRLDRPLRRRVDPTGGRLDLGQAGRLDRDPVDLDRARDRLRGDRLRDVPRLPLGDAGTVLLHVHGAVRAALRGLRHRQRLDLPYRGLRVRQGRARPRAGLDLCGGGLRLLHRSGGDRRPDQGRHARVRDVRLCSVLRPVRGPQLVVLPAQGRVHPEPLIPARPTDSLFQPDFYRSRLTNEATT